MNRAGFRCGSFLRPILHCVEMKFGYLQKGTSRSGTLSQTKDLENFASEYQSVCVIKLSRVTHWDQSASIKLFLKYFDLESTQLIARTHVKY